MRGISPHKINKKTILTELRESIQTHCFETISEFFSYCVYDLYCLLIGSGFLSSYIWPTNHYDKDKKIIKMLVIMMKIIMVMIIMGEQHDGHDDDDNDG